MQGKNDFACKEMLSALKNANSILLCTHISPDGDAIGSTLAAGMALERMGKKITYSCADPVPERLKFLPGAEKFVQAEALENQAFDLGFALDAADLSRLGNVAEAFQKCPVTVQLDHHGTNPCYAMFNEVDGHASASGCMVFRMLNALDAPITPEMAQCLYTAISTDTGNFCFDNANEEAFACVSSLMAAGLPLNETARRLHLLREEKHVRLLGRALCSLKIFGDGKCAGLRITREDFCIAEAGPEHCEKIVNYAMDMAGIEMAYLADERQEGRIKISLRAQPPRNVAAIARKFGGGGHVLAAGCGFEGDMESACTALEKEMLLQLEEKE